MAVVKPEVLISQLLDEIEKKFQRLAPIFRVQHFNGTIGNIAGCNRKSEIQYGGRQTGSTHISASRIDRSEIPTATPIFSGSSSSMELLGISPDVTGSQKFRFYLIYRLRYEYFRFGAAILNF